MSLMDTTDLERSILKRLFSDKRTCQLCLSRIKSEFMTSKARKFLLASIRQEFNDTRDILPVKSLEYEIEKRKQNRLEMLGEKNLISNADDCSNIDSLISKLRDAYIGRQSLEMIMEAQEALDKGEFLGSAKILREKSFSIDLSEDTKKVIDLLAYAPEHIATIKERRDNPDKYAGLKVGFPSWDDRMGGLHNGELTLVSGITGLGKSTILKAVEFGVLRNNKNKNILHIGNEEHELQMINKFYSVLTSVDYLDYKFANMTDDELSDVVSTLTDIYKHTGSRIYVREVPAMSDCSLIEKIYYEMLNDGIKIDGIFIDHLPNMSPIKKSKDKYQDQEQITLECKELARKFSIPVVIPTQASTETEELQVKGKRAKKLSVYGSKGQIHHANNYIIITYLCKDNNTVRADGSKETIEYMKNTFILGDVKKNRDGPVFAFKILHTIRNGRMDEIDIEPWLQAKIQREHEKEMRSGEVGTKIIAGVEYGDQEVAPVETLRGSPIKEDDFNVNFEEDSKPEEIMQPSKVMTSSGFKISLLDE
jgi:replicative DNA helicase